MYFELKFTKEHSIIAATHLERVPVYKDDDEELEKPHKYIYRQVMKLLQIILIEDRYLYFDISKDCKQYSKLQPYKDVIKYHPNKGKPFWGNYIKRELLIDHLSLSNRYIFNLNKGPGRTAYGNNSRVNSKDNPIYVPMIVKSKGESTWEDKNQIIVNEEAKETIDNEANQKAVIQFFEGLETYGIKFSENQRNLLISHTNTLVLGRSGTGKTTISALKILALDLLFMVYKKNKFNDKENLKLQYQDFEQFSGCKTVFCTASPVLTNEVKRFYNDLLQCIKDVLKQKELKSVKEESKESSQEDITEEDQKLRDGVIESLQRAKQDIIEDLEMEKQLVKYGSLTKVPSKDFPLFLTVKKLVYMLDARCSTTFFSRDKDSNIIGMDSSNEWHNESKEGALMINQYQKESFDFDQTIKKVGKELFQAEDMDDEEKVKLLQGHGIDIKDEELEGFLEVEEPSLQKKQSKSISVEDFLKEKKKLGRSKMSIHQQMFSREVDFEMFESKFYKKNKGSLTLSALKVWTEIYSVIKGGLNSLMSIRSYQADIIGYEEYCDIKSSIDAFDSEGEKYQLYMVYLQYEKWKKNKSLYDFMDVVRHVFQN